MNTSSDATIDVRGMTCQGCVQSVTRVLQAIPGVTGVDVSLERRQAQVRFDPAQTSPGAFREAIEQAGFEVA